MILLGDSRIVMQGLPAEYYHCCITSPPYLWVRDYGVPPSDWPETTYTPMTGAQPITVPAWIGCLGLEPTVEMFVAHIVLIMREVWRVLRKDGTLWLNFGDTYYGSGKGCNADGQRNFKGKDKAHNGRYTSNLRYKGFKAHLLKPKDLIMVPARVALALQADGWYVRSDIVWHKPNAMPESATDRPTKSHEYIYLFSKSRYYYYDSEAIKEPLAESSIARLSQDVANQTGSDRANAGGKKNGNMKAVGGSKGSFGPEQSRTRTGDVVNESGTRNKRSVWTISTAQSSEAHFATFPEKLIEPCILAGCPVGGRVLDPFGGSGTTKKVANENNRECTLIDINPAYVAIQERVTAVIQPNLF